jgi:hypothetical protein
MLGGHGSLWRGRDGCGPLFMPAFYFSTVWWDGEPCLCRYPLRSEVILTQNVPLLPYRAAVRYPQPDLRLPGAPTHRQDNVTILLPLPAQLFFSRLALPFTLLSTPLLHLLLSTIS